MAFIPVQNTCEAQVRMSLDSQFVENTLYFYKATGIDATLMTTLGNQLLLWWTTEYAVPLATSLSLREIYLTDLSSQNGPTVTIPAPAPAPTGGVGADALPNNVAACISFRTAHRGRSYRGRNYVPALPDTMVTLNEMAPSLQADLVDAYNGLFARATTAAVTWVVVSRFENGAPRTNGNAEPVTSVVLVDPIVDSQRRRLPGRGR